MYIIEFGGYCQKNWYAKPRTSEAKGRNSNEMLIFEKDIMHTARWDPTFFLYLLTWVVDLIEILEIMAQTGQSVIFLSLKPTKVTSDFILN